MILINFGPQCKQVCVKSHSVFVSQHFFFLLFLLGPLSTNCHFFRLPESKLQNYLNLHYQYLIIWSEHNQNNFTLLCVISIWLNQFKAFRINIKLYGWDQTLYDFLFFFFIIYSKQSKYESKYIF